MRKITEQASLAFRRAKRFSMGNTRVVVDTEKDMVKMYLHDNLIAYRHLAVKQFVITNKGWFSKVTKERLNALPNVSITQRDWKWYLNGEQWDGTPQVIHP